MKPELLRALPKMDLLLARPALAAPPAYALRRQAARQVLDEYRAALRAGALSPSPAWMSWSSPSSAGARSWPAPPWGG